MEKRNAQENVSIQISKGMLALFKIGCLKPQNQTIQWLKEEFQKQFENDLPYREEMIVASVKYTLQTDLTSESTLKPLFLENPEIMQWLYDWTLDIITQKSNLEKWIMVNRMITNILADGNVILDTTKQKGDLKEYAEAFLGREAYPISDSRLCRITMDALHCIKVCPTEHLANTYNRLTNKTLGTFMAISEIKRNTEYVFKQVICTWPINAEASVQKKTVYVN